MGGVGEGWHGDGAGDAPARVETVEAADGVALRAALWRPAGTPRGLVWLLQGRTEYLEKYAPFCGRLTAAGFAVAGLDWRGQGLSRRAPGAGRLGHVGDFAEYQRDLAALLAWGPPAEVPGPRLAVAHSMGGCIGLRGLLDGRLAPSAALFSAPMWGLALEGVAAWAAPAVAAAATRLGLGLRPAPGQGGGGPYVLSARFEDNVLVSDPGGWARFRREVEARPEFSTHAPTLGWLHAAFREIRALAAAPADPPPALVLLGSEERVVSADAIRARAARSPAAELLELPGARHEPLMEPVDGPVGARLAPALDAWLDRYAPA